MVIALTDSTSGGIRSSGAHFSLLTLVRPRRQQPGRGAERGREPAPRPPEGDWEARHYDSARGTHTRVAAQTLRTVRRARGWEGLPTGVTAADAPQQGPGQGCGLYTAHFAEWALRTWDGGTPPLTFGPETERLWRAEVQLFANCLQDSVPAAATASGRRRPLPRKQEHQDAGTPPPRERTRNA